VDFFIEEKPSYLAKLEKREDFALAAHFPVERKRSRFFSAKNPVNQQARKASFVFRGGATAAAPSGPDLKRNAAKA
jgi:hypothetical protein